MGSSSMVARISGTLCPLIMILGKYWAPLPLCVFGGSSILAGIVSMMLPETIGCNLPDTIQDGENFGSKSLQITSLSHSRVGCPCTCSMTILYQSNVLKCHTNSNFMNLHVKRATSFLVAVPCPYSIPSLVMHIIRVCLFVGQCLPSQRTITPSRPPKNQLCRTSSLSMHRMHLQCTVN